jgi:hypothetical protein
MQLLQQRVAWAAVEMFAMGAVISRLQSALEHAEGNGCDAQLARDLVVGRGYCRHAARRIRQRLRGLFRNSDSVRLDVADAVLGR